MAATKVFATGIRILGVCLAFAVCMVVGAALSGLNRIGRPETPSASSSNVQQAPLTRTAATSSAEGTPEARTQQASDNSAIPFLVFSVCVGVAVSYLILRSRWHGWTLIAAVFVGIYGIATIATQIESQIFLSNKLPHGLIRAVVLQGAIATVLFAPLAVLLLGKGRADSHTPESLHPRARRMPFSAWRFAVLVVAFVFLYMFFGYYVAWQNPALREYYAGPAYPNFLASLEANWIARRWIYLLQLLRALFYIACLYPLIRMLRGTRWEAAVAAAAFLSVWTLALLIPNPTMPASVAHSHFRETLSFSLLFGALSGWLLCTPNQTGRAYR